MGNQIRDTQFGHLARFVSSNRLLRYPDEIDPSLWTSCLSRAKPADTASEGHLYDSSEKDQPSADVENNPSSADHPMDIRARDSPKDDTHLVGWYGQDDPENPQAWSSRWKVLTVFQINLLNFAIYIASSIYVPGEKEVMDNFNVNSTVATLGLSLYTVGYGLGPMLWSPLSEMPRVGRRGIYIWTLLVYILLQVPTGYATNISMLLVFRLLTGFFGSPALATGGGTIADLYDPGRSAYGIVLLGFFGVLGPVFGPIVGGFVAPAKGWRWEIWVVTWLATAVLLMLFFLLPETSAANILHRRAQRLRVATGVSRLRSQSELDAANHTWRDHLRLLSTAFTLTFSEPIVFFLDLYTAILYGVLFTWFESFPFVFTDVYHFGSGEQGLAYLGILIGGIVTLPLFMLWIKYGLIPRFDRPNFKPEIILAPTFFGAATLPVCLFWYGWTGRAGIPWIVPIIGSGFFTCSIITLFFPVLNYLGMAYPEYVASVFAGNALFRASFGASFPLFARELFRTLGVGPGNSLLGGITVLFMVLPFIFYRYGERLRQMSRRARRDV